MTDRLGFSNPLRNAKHLTGLVQKIIVSILFQGKSTRNNNIGSATSFVIRTVACFKYIIQAHSDNLRKLIHLYDAMKSFSYMEMGLFNSTPDRREKNIKGNNSSRKGQAFTDFSRKCQCYNQTSGNTGLE
jgi:hypothetical protein